MFGWFAKRAQDKSAAEDTYRFPESESAVLLLMSSAQGLGAKNAREVAEIGAGRALSEAEWRQHGPRWERAWQQAIRRA